MTQNIQHLRLINGEEIVGDIIAETDTIVILDNPLQVEERKEESGTVLVLSKYIPFAKNQICELAKSHIITFNELHPELIRYYYNSLKLNESSEMKMIDEISRVNLVMEEIIDQDKILSKDHISRMSKGTNTEH